MKKIALTSLLAVFAAAGANAANTMDGNPMYMPAAGHFYSETALSTHTSNVDSFTLAEKFGYGITDRLAVAVNTSASEAYWFHGNPAEDATTGQGRLDETYPSVGNAWNNLGVDLDWRMINKKSWKVDLRGGFDFGAAPFSTMYMTEGMMASVGAVWGDHAAFLDKDNTFYTWRADVRAGYVTEDWTLSAHAGLLYVNTKAFNWGSDDAEFVVAGEEVEGGFWMNHVLNVGVAGHWTMSDNWSAYASADYYKIMDHYSEADNRGYWDATLGLNMNLDDTKYVGAYLSKTMYRMQGGFMNVQGVAYPALDGFKVGMKFGIDF